MNFEVVLATYNGSAWVAEQMQSIAAQTILPAAILVGDDGSNDGTPEMVDCLGSGLRLSVVRRSFPPGAGASGNFSRLLESSTADYVFLADQDDVWDSDKAALSLAAMRKLEARWGRDTPLLVHTDLRVVDADLLPIAPSFLAFQRLFPERTALQDLLLQNVVTGCTVVVNRALLQKALPVPHEAAMHDWWLALVAAAFGQIGFVGRATMSYRQHGANQVGAKGWSLTYLVNRLKRLSNRGRTGDLLRPLVVQAGAFLQRYGDMLAPGDRALVQTFARLPEMSGVARVAAAVRSAARKHGVARTVALYWALLWADFRGQVDDAK